MNAAILCPGPSLPMFDGKHERYDLTLAINRASLAYPVDVWCFMDWGVFEGTRLDYQPAILTTATAVTHLERRGHALGGWNVTTFEEVRDGYPLKSGPCFTVVMAVYYAFWLGTRRIDLYGADMTAAPDWDGVSMIGNNREPDRWGREGVLLADLTDELRKRGCEVARVLNHGTA